MADHRDNAAIGSNISLQGPSVAQDALEHGSQRRYSRLRVTTVIVQLSGVNFTTSACNGLVVVGLPAMTKSLSLPSSLAFWPSSVSSLTTASTLLLAGSIADAIGPRWVDILGCLSCGFVMIGAGLARTGEELVAMRAISGVGLAMHLASSVSITTAVLAQGRGRNIAFGCLGLSQVLGFSFGLIIGGLLIESLGWRAGWHLYGGITVFFALLSVWGVPKSPEKGRGKQRLDGLKKGVDWVGAGLASTFMATLCYMLAIISTDVNRIKGADAIVCVCLAVVAAGAFIIWMDRQVNAGKKALIPNSLWRNVAFSSICATISLSYATMSAMELFCSLFYQEVQHLSELQASIRILPSMIIALGLNLLVGLFIHKVSAFWTVVVSSILCAGSPLLMAVIQPEWIYWTNAFIAQLLQPISADVLFTAGLVFITEVFPDDTQALAGAVFNTAGQFGVATGLALLQVVSTLTTKGHADLEETLALMEGYRASFWAMFGFMLSCALIGALGLRKVGKIGVKQD